MSTLHTRSATGSSRQTALDPRSLITTVCARPSAWPHVVSLTEHAAALRCSALLPDMDAEVAGLRCASPGCCDAPHRAMYARIVTYAEHVRRWKMMVATPESITIGTAKVGPDFEVRVRRSIQTTVANVSILWRTMYTESLFVKAPVRILAPMGGGPPLQVDDFVNGLAPDVLSVVLALVIRQTMEAGEPVGNICRLRRTCTAFATHHLFEPFTPRIVPHSPTRTPGASGYSAFPHRPSGTNPATPATVCARRELAVDLRLSLPGAPAAERLFAVEGGPLHGGVGLTLRLEATHPDGSTHDITDRLLQKRALSCRARESGFRLEGASPRACTRFNFGLLSSTIDGELRSRYSEPLATPASFPRDLSQLGLGEIATAARTTHLERGESVTGVKRIRKRGEKTSFAPVPHVPPAMRGCGVRAPRPSPKRPRGPLSTFRFVAVPTLRRGGTMPFLRWESEPFVSAA